MWSPNISSASLELPAALGTGLSMWQITHGHLSRVAFLAWVRGICKALNMEVKFGMYEIMCIFLGREPRVLVKGVWSPERLQVWGQGDEGKPGCQETGKEALVFIADWVPRKH